MILIYLIGTLSFFLILFRYRQNKYNLPPGPPKLPVIGSLLSVFLADAGRPMVAFQKLGKKYGPIFSLQLGSQGVVVINSHVGIVKALSLDELQCRVDESDVWLLEKNQNLGILMSNSTFWAETRGITHKILRKYGFNSKATTELIILEEINDFCNGIQKVMNNGRVCLKLTTQFNVFFLNIMRTLLTGKKYEAGDLRSAQMIRMIDTFIKSGQIGGTIAQIFPFCLTLFPRLTGFTEHKNACAKGREAYREVINEVRSEGAYMEAPNSFLEEFLEKVDKPNKEELVNGMPNIYTEENLMAVLQDFDFAGPETQANSIRYFIRFLVYYPEVQVKLQEEVDRVVGRTRAVNSDDISRLVYSQATLHEVFRHATTGPVLPRKLMKNWKFDKFEIPKGTLILLNAFTGDKDESVWPEPLKFIPERFLSQEGKLINTEKILSFGIGKRRCLGEQLAKTSLLLVMTTLIQQFTFHVDPATGFPCQEVSFGLTLGPVPFNVLIKSR